MAFLSSSALADIGFASLGRNVLISDKASIYGAERIEIGDNVRVDDFCILSAGEGGICLGSFIHIAAYTSIIGGGRVVIGDYGNISSRVSIYSSNDDYSGEYMTNPMIDSCYTNVTRKPVSLDKHVIVGSGSVLLPGISVEEGVAVGAMSLVNKPLKAWGVYAGQPAVWIKDRKKGLLLQEEAFRRHILTSSK